MVAMGVGVGDGAIPPVGVGGNILPVGGGVKVSSCNDLVSIFWMFSGCEVGADRR